MQNHTPCGVGEVPHARQHVFGEPRAAEQPHGIAARQPPVAVGVSGAEPPGPRMCAPGQQSQIGSQISF